MLTTQEVNSPIVYVETKTAGEDLDMRESPPAEPAYELTTSCDKSSDSIVINTSQINAEDISTRQSSPVFESVTLESPWVVPYTMPASTSSTIQPVFDVQGSTTTDKTRETFESAR